MPSNKTLHGQIHEFECVMSGLEIRFNNKRRVGRTENVWAAYSRTDTWFGQGAHYVSVVGLR